MSNHLAASTLAVDLNQRFLVGRAAEMPRSPLDLLLGVDGSATRYLEVAASAAGVDWACEILGQPVPAEGSEITGTAAVDLVARALAARSAEIAALVTATESLGELDASQPHKVALDRLLGGVRIKTGPGLWVAPGDASGRLVLLYESDDLLSLAAVELALVSEAGAHVAKCGHCQRPFIPRSRVDEMYCLRSVPGGATGRKTCRDVGPQRRYAAKLDDVGASYRRNYKRLDNRQRRGHLSRSDLDEWRIAARGLLVRAESGRWSPQRFDRELKQIDPKAPTEGLD